MTEIALSRIQFPVTTLGPGRRIAVWFQGCSIRCAGCISMDTWAPGRGLTSVEAVLQSMEPHLREADGLTVSGGEPFEQLPALTALLRGWRARHAGDVLAYSGQPLEDLAPALAKLTGFLDVVIADPFVAGEGDRLALRGSDNQRMVPLSALGRRRFGHLIKAPSKDRTLDVIFDERSGDAFMAGIPRRGDLARLREILKARGNQAAITQDRRVHV